MNVEEWVSAEFQRLAEIVHDYDPYLYLEHIPPHKRVNPEDKKNAFRIMDTRTNTIVFHMDSLSNPVDILAKLFEGDNRHGDVLKRLDAHNAAVEAMKLKEKLDRQEAIIDFTSWVLANEKNYWTHEGRKRDADFRDLGPVRKVVSE